MKINRFENKVAVVTGGASGIGAAIVRQLLEEGASVAAGDTDGERLAAMETELGAQFAGVVADVTREEDVAAMVAAAADRFGNVGVAFNVAGGGRGGPIVDLSEADWDFTVDLVLKGVFLSTKHEARQMRQGGVRGAIVIISSLNAHIPMFGGSPYASGKAGVEMFTKSAALEFARDGIRVNTVLPGLVDTPATTAILNNAVFRQDYVDHILLARPASVVEIAEPSLYLASDEASYITGSSLVVDGGWSITGYPDLSRYVPWDG